MLFDVCLVMELVAGGDLFDEISNSVKFEEVLASSFARDIAKALKYLHQQNIVHRDVKPENLLVRNLYKFSTSHPQIYLYCSKVGKDSNLSIVQNDEGTLMLNKMLGPVTTQIFEDHIKGQGLSPSAVTEVDF